jgi:hypothetical protein
LTISYPISTLSAFIYLPTLQLESMLHSLDLLYSIAISSATNMPGMYHHANTTSYKHNCVFLDHQPLTYHIKRFVNTAAAETDTQLVSWLLLAIIN